MELTVKINHDEWRKNLVENAAAHSAALKTAANMIASMLREQITADIASAGAFGSKFTPTVTVSGTGNGVSIHTKIEGPGAEIFEKGGVIHGKPLLWLPISGTDAEGIQASNYGDQLFSVNRLTGGPPLLFSIKDHAPKYFGIPSVNIPKKFHVAEIEKRIMDSFPQVYLSALKR